MSENEYSCSCDIIHRDIVERVSSAMLDERVLNAASKFLKAMADPTRFKILWSLNEHEMCVCDLSSVLGMTKSAISHQLATLRKANLVKYRRDGKVVYYSIADDHVHHLLDESLNHAQEPASQQSS